MVSQHVVVPVATLLPPELSEALANDVGPQVLRLIQVGYILRHMLMIVWLVHPLVVHFTVFAVNGRVVLSVVEGI